MPRNNALALQDMMMARYAVKMFKGAKFCDEMYPDYADTQKEVRRARFKREYEKELWKQG